MLVPHRVRFFFPTTLRRQLPKIPERRQRMKGIGPFFVASLLNWPVALVPQALQPWPARQFDASHQEGTHRDRENRHRVDCDQTPSGALQKAIAATHPGDTLVVNGTCNEHVTIPVDKISITLDGGGTATISGSDPAQPTVLVRGRDVAIQGFTINGGVV